VVTHFIFFSNGSFFLLLPFLFSSSFFSFFVVNEFLEGKWQKEEEGKVARTDFGRRKGKSLFAQKWISFSFASPFPLLFFSQHRQLVCLEGFDEGGHRQPPV